jgi:hypothetical protein
MGASVAKKTRCYATGLNLVPLSDVKNNGYERPQELSRRLRAEQAAEEAKALKAAELADPIFIAKKEFEERVNQTSREVTARLTKWWGRSVPDCEEGIRFDECPVDDIGLEQTETPVPMPDFERAITAYAETLPAKGVTFTDDDSRRKWALFCWNAASTGTCINNETLTRLTERAGSLGIGITLPRAKVKQATEKPEATFDDIASTLSTQSDAGNKALRIAAVDAALTGEVRQTWAAFKESLYRNFNGFLLTDAQGLTFYRAMVERRANFLRPTDYDSTRVSLTRSGDLPAHLRFPHEQLQIDMETADLSDPEVRRTFNHRERQLQGR